MNIGEHEFEAAHGLPEPLPQGERLLWQGRPDAGTLAREAMHWRPLALYFAVILAWRGVDVAASAGLWPAVIAVAGLLPLAGFAVGMAWCLAILVARTTVYTLTDKRLVLRIGIVLSLTFNLPLRQIASAGLRRGGAGEGDIALELVAGTRIAYLNLWPHARPWRLKEPQPMLRAVPEVQRVAALLAEALKASADPQAVARMQPSPAEALPPIRVAVRPEARAA
ncbi:photosynthetic complex putative assembly protein PuhB [Ideonella sp. DXS29W]|uniref:Photosynthetic complex putative assembly protein PuhB n=1 Tax=Ideonella lacteola TaxID=2984193 RepID=A0ABU9BMU1_9BURK